MRTSRPLDEYRRKRDPTRTPEPMGGRTRRTGARFVIHKHAARRLHYDLRLEIDGVLKSWAVPKGPSVDPASKRLAVQVEDHPLDYGGFEGVIPVGNYGAGPVIIWDRGSYGVHGAGTAATQLAKGHLDLELTGAKLRGRWQLVRIRGRGEKNGKSWLLIKSPDADAVGPEPTETQPESVVSGHTLAELEDDPPPAVDPAGRRRARAGQPAPRPSTALARRLAALHLPPARLTPAALPLMLPTLVAALPAAAGWLFEIKWDGVRVLALRARDRVTLWSRTGTDITARYPEVAAALARLPGGDLALDGEIVVLDEQGRPTFARLQRRMHLTRNVEAAAAAEPVTVYVYDCLVLDGRDLRSLSLAERKKFLARLLPAGGSLRYCDHIEGDGPAFLEEVCAAGLEGVLAKRADSPYRGGRRTEWRKIKCHRRQEFVIGGYTEPKGTRAHLGAVHVGVYDSDALVYVGKVGSGLDTAGLGALHDSLRALAADRCPFTRGQPPRGREHHWVEPRLVCEVRFAEWTADGNIRHPIFLGLRTDRPPRSVRREVVASRKLTAARFPLAGEPSPAYES